MSEDEARTFGHRIHDKEEDVEAHGRAGMTSEPAEETDDDDDVEAHGHGRINSPRGG